MKKLFFAVFSLFIFTACEGDRGPMGPPGPQGPYIVGAVFEIANVNLNPANNYSFLGFYYDYIPDNIEIYPSDVVLIYLLEGVTDDGRDVWSLMPQTYYRNGGTVQYNYNHTVSDFEIYLQGNINLNSLPPNFTQNQVFRIALLPADFAMDNTINIEDYNSVINAMRSQNPDFEVLRSEE